MLKFSKFWEWQESIYEVSPNLTHNVELTSSSKKGSLKEDSNPRFHPSSRALTNNSNFQELMIHMFLGALIKFKQHRLIGIRKQASKTIHAETCSYPMYNYTMPFQNPNHGKVSDAQIHPFMFCAPWLVGSLWNKWVWHAHGKIDDMWNPSKSLMM